MSHKKKDRLDTLRVLIGGRSCLCNSSRLTDIYGEINRIATSDQVPRHNGWLRVRLSGRCVISGRSGHAVRVRSSALAGS